MKRVNLLKLYEGTGDYKEYGYSKEERAAFLEAVKNYQLYDSVIHRSGELLDVVTEINELVEMANTFTLQETDGWFDNVTASRHMKQMTEAVKVMQKEASEIVQRQQRLEAAYEDVGQLLGKYYDI